MSHMQITPSSSNRIFTVQSGKVVPFDHDFQRYNASMGVSGALALPGIIGVNDATNPATYTHDSKRKGRNKATPLRDANRAAWGMAKDAFTVSPSGAPFLDLIGRITEVALMPRPPALFDLAFPDVIPFQPGVERVTADLIMWSGRPMVGWRNSTSDIPEYREGSVTTQLSTAWLVLNVPITMQDAARSQISGATMNVSDRLSRAMGEFELAIDYLRWNGNTAAQIDGILNHPFLSRYQDLDIQIGGTGGSSSSAIYASFIDVATYAKSSTKGAGTVDTCIMSYQIIRKLANQFLVIGGTAVAKTLLQAIEEEYSRLGIKILPSEQPWWPLDDVGGSGVHGVMFYSREYQRAPAALQGMEATAYPDQSNPLVQNTYIVACVGDVHLRQAQSTLLAQYTVG